jgi:hypothetical protein
LKYVEVLDPNKTNKQNGPVPSQRLLWPGRVVSALKVMQLLAEEGCTDAEMTEARGNGG